MKKFRLFGDAFEVVRFLELKFAAKIVKIFLRLAAQFPQSLGIANLIFNLAVF